MATIACGDSKGKALLHARHGRREGQRRVHRHVLLLSGKFSVVGKYRLDLVLRPHQQPGHGRRQVGQSWLGKFAQGDKWNFCRLRLRSWEQEIP